MTNEQDVLREVIREVVREVIREVIAEELSASTNGPTAQRPAAAATPWPRRAGTPPVGQDAPVAGLIARGVLSERHVRAAGKGGRVTIARAVVVTPLARERAKSMGVEIVRMDG